MRHLVTLLIAMAISLPVWGWGPKGHDTVAYIAECHLSKRAKRKIENLLNCRSMVYVANWMDSASHTEEYAHTKTWHYVNVDADEADYATSRKEPMGDVVTAINTLVSELQSGELSPEQERIELMMLIHLVGDMHCPMHAGYKSDRGGNGTKIKFFGKQQNLHSLWDSDIVESAHRWSYTEWQQQIDRATRKDVKRYAEGTPDDWIEETSTLAKDIYSRTPSGANLSYDYVNHYTPTIEDQLLKGGIRLAALLEEIY